jgi:hypothetical protein
MSERKVSLNVNVEFYPDENDEFREIFAGKSDAEAYRTLRALVVTRLREVEVDDGLWYHIDEEVK